MVRRSAMLVRYCVMAMCLSVRLSVRHKSQYSIKTAKHNRHHANNAAWYYSLKFSSVKDLGEISTGSDHTTGCQTRETGKLATFDE